MKSVVATDSSNNLFVGWTLAGSTWLLTHTDSLKLLFFHMFRVFCWLNVTFKSTLPPILLMLICFIHTLHDTALNLFCIWDRHLHSGFSSHLIVSSHFVTKTTTCCICMWKLSFLKYGITHLIGELYYKIGRWFIFRKKTLTPPFKLNGRSLRINHNILATNYFLKKFKIIDDANCNFCQKEKRL